MSFRSTIIVLSLLLLGGCTTDNSTAPPSGPSGTDVTIWNDAGYWESVLDATSSDTTIYFNIDSMDVVDVADASSSTDWHLAFKRDNAVTNSGDSGPFGVMGVDLNAVAYAHATEFDSVMDASMVVDGDWGEDETNLSVDEWYAYDPVGHSLAVTGFVYTLKDAAGNYAKIQVATMDNNGMPPDMGTITLKYFLQTDGSTNLDDPGDTLIIDGSAGGPIYVDLSAGDTVTVADPTSSTDWDFCFVGYEIHLNCPLWGAGAAAAYPGFVDLADSTDFDALVEFPAGAPMFQDVTSSIMSDWYEYMGPPTHQLLSNEYVYLIRIDTAIYKLQIQSYYRDVNGTPQSGWYSFRWLELE